MGGATTSSGLNSPESINIAERRLHATARGILEKEALKLSPGERALLADALLSSLDDESARQIEGAWAQLAEDRNGEYKAGKTTCSDGPTVIQNLRQRLAK